MQRRKRTSTPPGMAGHVESLEARELLSAAALLDDPIPFQANSACGCAMCMAASVLVEDPGLPTIDSSPGGSGETSGTSSGPSAAALAPAYNSKADALASVFLDFDGHFEADWNGYANATTPVFDTDGNTGSFSASELSVIYEIWQRVSEDFAPFNINVTTEAPANLGHGSTLTVAIGGSYSDWYGSSAGGVAWIDSFRLTYLPNVVYVFANNLSNNAKYVAEAVSHEAGHGFGLYHQRQYSGSTLVNEYHPGSNGWAPIMGNSYAMAISTWHDGQTYSSIAYQDDMALISRSANGFGYRVDDFGNTLGAASAVNVVNGSFAATGIIAQNSDADVFSFSAGSGSASFQINVATVGANLDAVLEIYNSSGALIASSNPSTQSASLSTTLSAGTYYALVKSNGMYGRVGQYTFSGQVAAATGNQAPSVNAGTDQSISISGSASLNGTVSDDGLPSSPGTVATTWSKVSGAGTVAFGNASAVDTTATFSIAGTYVLRLTANDGESSAYDEVTIVVNPVNTAPSVSAGPDRTIFLNGSASLDGTVSDDGLPGALTFTWTKVSGAGTVAFGNASAVDTTATFSAAGTYVLRLTAGDGQLSSSDEMTVVVNPSNAAPSANAGSDQSILLAGTASLNGTVGDDGMPISPGALTTTWTKVSGSGTVTFGSASAVDTTATFSLAGTYVLRLSASDGQLTTTDDVTIVVNPQMTTATTTFQHGANGWKGAVDTKIAGNNAGANYGKATSLDIDGSPDIAAFLHWDLGSIPTGAAVQSVSITLRVTSTSTSTFEIYEALRPWNETQATWKRPSTGLLWGAAGAQQLGVDRGSTVLGVMTSSATGFVTFTLNSAGVAAVQRWINNPSTNFGFVIQDYDNASGDNLAFHSKNTGTVANRPKLTIQYQSAAGAETMDSPNTTGGSGFVEQRQDGTAAGWSRTSIQGDSELIVPSSAPTHQANVDFGSKAPGFVTSSNGSLPSLAFEEQDSDHGSQSGISHAALDACFAGEGLIGSLLGFLTAPAASVDERPTRISAGPANR